MILDRSNHQFLLVVLEAKMMCDAISNSSGIVAIQLDTCLAVEVHRRFVLIQVVEYGRKTLSAIDDLRRYSRLGVVEYFESRVSREECHLSFRISRIGAKSISVH